jgi:hypothetical protein
MDDAVSMPEPESALSRSNKLRPGEALIKMGRHANEQRKRGASVLEIARELKIGSATLALVCDIVSLAERGDLNARDSTLAYEAYNALLAGERPVKIYESLEPISVRLWGGSSARGASRETTEQRRTEQFERAMGMTLQVCANALRIDVPHLPPHRANAVCKDLNTAIRQLAKLRTKVEDLK